MTLDIQQFKIRFPEFENNDDAVIALLATDAEAVIGTDPNHWCGNYHIAHAYLTAHLMATRAQAQAMAGAGASDTATSGPITNKSAHGVSVSYAQPTTGHTTADMIYAKTNYGAAYLAERDRCFAGTARTAAICSSGRAGLVPTLGVRLRGY